MRILKWTVSAVVISMLVVGITAWIRYDSLHPSTSDAYVSAAVVRISPRITGKLDSIPVHDYDHVEQGQLLLQIDPQPYRIALERARSNLALATQQRNAAQAAVESARALVSQHRAELEDARRNHQRTQKLLQQKSISQAQADSVRFKLKEIESAYQASVADLGRMQGRFQEAAAQIRVAQTAVEEATMNLGYTRILAPVSGYLGKLEVRPGNVVQAGQPLFPLVEDQSAWVYANFKETDLHRIQPGQQAHIRLDMYPGRTFNGVIESLSPASGVAFSLLPPENATGNWVKVTQRFPVRIAFTDQDPGMTLRIGASSTVTVDTSSGRPLQQQPQAVASDARQPTS